MTTQKTSNFSIVVLISGNGSNLQAIIDAIQIGCLPAHLSAVISNCPSAYGLVRAQTAGIPTHIIPHTDYHSRENFEAALKNILYPYCPELLVLAGFMRRLTPSFIAAYRGRIINIHPALLPQYPGRHTHQRVLGAGEKHHGASVHYVTEVLDAGPLICQAKFLISPEDTINMLKTRTLSIEHCIYPKAISWISARRLRLLDDQVFFDNHLLPKTGQLIKIKEELAPTSKLLYNVRPYTTRY